MQAASCPSATELARFAVGDLPERAFSQLAGHVERCPECEKALQELDGVPDLLVSQLRRLADSRDANVCMVSTELLQALRSARAQRGSWNWPAADGPLRLGKFELLEKLGVGSFGYVFRARDTELDRIVAVKILRAGRLASPQEIDRFFREARSAAQLKHPGIVSIYETGQTPDGTCYLVEEFIAGTTLAHRLGDDRLSLRQAAQLVAEVADALHYAHEHGVIHRDVKPSNIMIEAGGLVAGGPASGKEAARTRHQAPDTRHQAPKLMDFGLAKREAEDAPMTLDGQVLGTPAYMSPEQARGDSHQVDARSDIYSLGVVLYELLTGERPFHGNRRMLLLQVLQDEPRPPRQLNDQIPRDLETICLKAMARTPLRRYATASEVAADLRRWLNGEPIRARPVGVAERLWRWCRRNPVAASLLLAVSLGSTFGLIYLSLLSKQLVRMTALESAAQQAEMLVHVHDHYSDVVDGVKHQGYEVTHDPRTRGASKGVVDMEVPARFTINLGMRLNECGQTGMQARLFSEYPFRSRKDGGPRDEFERYALYKLKGNPDEPVHRFEDFDGKPVVRYALARRMKASCIDCHNHHPDSVKHDWQEGDFRGVVEIIRPLDKDTARAREGLRGTFVLIGAISLSLLGISGLILLTGKRRRP